MTKGYVVKGVAFVWLSIQMGSAVKKQSVLKQRIDLSCFWVLHAVLQGLLKTELLGFVQRAEIQKR